ncbi:glycoside hydrolase family 43 protein [Sediminitomix flava]|uniref:Alpha-N-arabinofuranosidase n=1 Tax=Sediminitomix flava TaxID=379075 RepID=A0A315ZXN3_SEDFL|nr:glycoside hydrolase family 43 protein [Sediminitomix flava]PWJ42107.1 alpha-N-arabinofuranosidase [Sediminitomix flava]
MKNITLLAFLLSLTIHVFGQGTTFTNPIISGGYPDPSITYDGEYYYIVNSSFEYFPGLPIHRSKDLVNWECIGHGLHRKEQCNGKVNLLDVQSDGGIHAPTVRYHDGLFYIITTNVYSPAEGEPAQLVNFIITAENAEGPWSEPHVIEGAPGIDPDIFFDDNGRVWYVGQGAARNPSFSGEGEIWTQELDLENWKLKGERHYLWTGACGGVWAEGPHMYKHDGRYYLMIAEGGTGFEHAVMIAVSDNVIGPFTSNPRNPVLTTRNLSYDNWVNSTGHADMIQLADGRWYMVALGIRNEEARASNMARETHLLPMQWEREPYDWKETKYEWPVAAPETGRILRNTPLPFADKPQYRNDAFIDHFENERLDLEWNFRRIPKQRTYSLSDHQGYLRLYTRSEIIQDRVSCSWIGFRQKESDFEYSAKMNFKAKKENVEAGISLLYKDNKYINFTLEKGNNSYNLKLNLAQKEKEVRTLKSKKLETYKGEIIFKVISKNHTYQYFYSLDQGKSYELFTTTSANLILGDGYTGANLGLYTSSNGQKSSDYADFDWVNYKGFERK